MSSSINLDQLAERGRISQEEAQGIHASLHHKTGSIDSDFIISDWNARSPESLWDQDGDSGYIRYLTDIVVAFMADKVGGNIDTAQGMP